MRSICVRGIRTTTLAAALCAALAAGGTHELLTDGGDAVAAKRRTRTSRLLFGAYAPASDQDQLGAVPALESAVRSKLDVVHFYQAWRGGGEQFQPALISAAASNGRAPLLTWEPWLPGGSAQQPDFSLSTILSGRYDDYIRTWAQGFTSVPGLVYLRPMHEMNGNWYPWSAGVNGNSVAEYVAVWRKIHTIFRDAGVVNVRWVWSPYAVDVPSTNRFESYYPGAGYVDVVALDGYNWGSCEPTYGGWLSFDQVFSNAYNRVLKMGLRKPMWVAETSSAPQGGDKAAWASGMFTALKTKFTYVRAVVWYSRDRECDWRATSPSSVATALAAGLAAR